MGGSKEGVGEISCPVCGRGGLKVSQIQYEVPNLGPLGIFTVSCALCGFKQNDVMQLETHPPACYTAKIMGVEDLKTIVIRSSTGALRIPELGARIDPGSKAEGFISNVEGVLERLENAVKSSIVLSDDEGAKKRGEKFFLKLKKARDGAIPFTLILKDPLGHSVLHSEVAGKVRKRRLTGREIRSMRTPALVLVSGEGSKEGGEK